MACFVESIKGIGSLILIIGFVLLIPSIIGFIWASEIYGDPITEPGGNLLLNGTAIEKDFEFKEGENYNIKIRAYATNSTNFTGSIVINVKLTSTGGVITTWEKSLSESIINGTSKLVGSGALDIEEDLTVATNVTISFIVASNSSIDSARYEIEIYQSPNRTLSGIVSGISGFLMIPGLIVCVCGVCVSGTGVKTGS